MHPEFTNIEALIFGLSYCAFMLGLGFIFLKFPPGKINELYGYRTFRTKKNIDVWNAANRYWTRLFVKLNAMSFVFPLLIYFVYPQQTVLATVIASTILLLASIPLTEIYLNKHFDKEGNRI